MNEYASLAEPDSYEAVDRPMPAADAGPFGWLPRVPHRQVGLERRLDRLTRGGLPLALDWLQNEIGTPIEIDRPEILWRASGLGRSGLVAQLAATRLATRAAIGVEIPLAHTIVDRLLGFDRAFAETRLQLSPAEWGVWTFLFLRGLDSFPPAPGGNPRESAANAQGLGLSDFTLDRVGPDPFDTSSLGSIATIRWPVKIGTIAGSVRLWLPDSIVSLWLASPAAPEPARRAGLDPTAHGFQRVAPGDLGSSWRGLAGTTIMSQGLRRLRTGGVLPFSLSSLRGTPASPDGEVDLVLDLDGQETRFRMSTRPVPDSGGRLVRVETGPRMETRPRDPIDGTQYETKIMNTQPQASSGPSPAAPTTAPLDVPITLTVELGRVNLTLTQLADLKPGDVIELNRHSKAAIELTSNGRLVARGELILIDTDLGVRVTNVFL